MSRDHCWEHERGLRVAREAGCQWLDFEGAQWPSRPPFERATYPIFVYPVPLSMTRGGSLPDMMDEVLKSEEIGEYEG